MQLMIRGKIIVPKEEATAKVMEVHRNYGNGHLSLKGTISEVGFMGG